MGHVLIVDDNQLIRGTIRELLAGQGHTVDDVGDGQEAIALLRASPSPFVALIDLHLGRWEEQNPVIAALTADPMLAARHAYIWMTAGSMAEAEQDTSPLGWDRVTLITKPFDLKDLFSMVTEGSGSLLAPV